jgi:hypothetical protein
MNSSLASQLSAEVQIYGSQTAESAERRQEVIRPNCVALRPLLRCVSFAGWLLLTLARLQHMM